MSSYDVTYGNVSSQSAGALYLYSVIKNPNMNFVIDTIVTMQNGIRDNLMYRLPWIYHPFQPRSSNDRNLLNHIHRALNTLKY